MEKTSVAIKEKIKKISKEKEIEDVLVQLERSAEDIRHGRIHKFKH
jgi:hypothetical protein